MYVQERDLAQEHRLAQEHHDESQAQGVGEREIDQVLNDFKAVEGDRVSNVRSLPVLLGERRAAVVACYTMALPQLLVAILLSHWGAKPSAILVIVSIAAQFLLMQRLLSNPAKYAPFYNATGTSLYVLGMLASAFGLRALT